MGNRGRGVQPAVACPSSARHFLYGLLIAALGACSGDSSAGADGGPLVRLHVSPLDPTAIQAVLTVDANDVTGQIKTLTKTFTSGPFDPLGVSFPAGTRASTNYKVEVSSSAGCLVASGTASLNIDSDNAFDVSVPMSAVPYCGGGATVTVTVANVLGGTGSVTSSPAGINCQGAGNGCSVTVMKGAKVTLTANTMTGSFAGWSGGGCTGLAPCDITASQDAQVQAVFSACKGWCKETLPFAVNTTLNGVWGTSSSNVLVVGDSGTALHFDGMKWSMLTPASGAGVALRAASSQPTSNTVYVVGDAGTMLTWSNGALNQIKPTPMVNLHAVAVGVGKTPKVVAVGEGGAGIFVTTNNGNAMSMVAPMAGNMITLNALAEAYSANKDAFYVGGGVVGNHGYAWGDWDGSGGAGMIQMMTGPNIAGNINAMACANTYYYAAGDNGAIVRRSNAAMMNNMWTQVASGMTTNAMRGLWASGDSLIVAVGDGGTILQSDGTNWTQPVSGITNSLRAVWGSSSANIYAVGANGTILHYTP